MLGQPVSMLIPKVVGFKLTGAIPTGVTATDVVLTITADAAQARRRRQVRRVLRRGRRRGPAREPRHHRQHEPGVRLDRRDVPDRRRDARLPAPHRPQRGADRARRGVLEAAEPLARPVEASRCSASTSSSTSPPSSRRSPARSARRTASILADAKEQFEIDLVDYADDRPRPRRPDEVSESFPASDPAGTQPEDEQQHARAPPPQPRAAARASSPTQVTLEDGPTFTLDHGAVAIAAITSCTNTSNPSVMLAAGLLARNAVEEGPHVEAVGQDHARPGLEGRHRLLREGRTHRRPRGPRLLHRRLRLHDLHRQLRPAARRDLGRRSTTTTWPSPRCSPATATSRAGSTPT